MADGTVQGRLIALGDRRPRVHPGAFVAPTATLVGDVVVEEGASVWYGAVLRADLDAIVVGRETSIQDNTVIHTNHGMPTLVGEGATIGHAVVLEGCRIGDGAMIGMNATVLNGADVGAGALVAAGAVVLEGGVVPAGRLAAGVPARVRDELSPEVAALVADAPGEYAALRELHRRHLGD